MKQSLVKIIFAIFGAAVAGLLFVLLVNTSVIRHVGFKGEETVVDESIATIIKREKISSEIIFDDYGS